MRAAWSTAEGRKGKDSKWLDSTTDPDCVPSPRRVQQGPGTMTCRNRAPRTHLALCRVAALSQAVLNALTLTDEVLMMSLWGKAKNKAPLSCAQQ